MKREQNRRPRETRAASAASGETLATEAVRLPVGLKLAVRRLASREGVSLQAMYARVLTLGVGALAAEVEGAAIGPVDPAAN
jgi:hypothetical protein